MNVTTEVDVKKFLLELNDSLGCSYNIQRSRQDKRQGEGKQSLSKLRGFRKCVFNVSKTVGAKDKQVGKNTECESTLNFRLENSIGSESDKKDRMEYPLWIKLHYMHKHSLSCADFF